MSYILNVRVDVEKSHQDIMNVIDKMVSENSTHTICTTNPEFIIQANKDSKFLDIINKCDISLVDGYGILLAYSYMNRIRKVRSKLPKIITFCLQGAYTVLDSILNTNIQGECIRGVDLFYDICSYAQKNNKNIFLLGGWPKDFLGRRVKINSDLASDAAIKLKQKYEGLKIIGSTSKFSYREEDDKDTLDYILSCMKDHNVDHIDFLFVAYNHPNQEKWIDRNAYKIPARVSMGVGGTFDYVVYPEKRAPEVFITHRLEWLYKLITQPWRLKRVLNAFPVFPIKVYLNSLKTYNK